MLDLNLIITIIMDKFMFEYCLINFSPKIFSVNENIFTL